MKVDILGRRCLHRRLRQEWKRRKPNVRPGDSLHGTGSGSRPEHGPLHRVVPISSPLASVRTG